MLFSSIALATLLRFCTAKSKSNPNSCERFSTVWKGVPVMHQYLLVVNFFYRYTYLCLRIHWSMYVYVHICRYVHLSYSFVHRCIYLFMFAYVDLYPPIYVCCCVDLRLPIFLFAYMCTFMSPRMTASNLAFCSEVHYLSASYFACTNSELQAALYSPAQGICCRRDARR